MPSGESGCLNVRVCACRVSYRILGFGKEETPKLNVDVEGVYST